jgi:hypothetical protein
MDELLIIIILLNKRFQENTKKRKMFNFIKIPTLQ